MQNCKKDLEEEEGDFFETKDSIAPAETQISTSPATVYSNKASNSTSVSDNDVIEMQRRVACTCPNCTNGEQSFRKRQHNCHFIGCNKVYEKPSLLRIHLRNHTGKNISDMIITSWLITI